MIPRTAPTIPMIMGMVIGVMMGIVIFVAIIFVKGLLLVKDTALLGALLLHELVVYGALFPGDFLLLAIEGKEKNFWVLLLLLLWLILRGRGGRWIRALNGYGGGGGGGGGGGRRRYNYRPRGAQGSGHGCSIKGISMGCIDVNLDLAFSKWIPPNIVDLTQAGLVRRRSCQLLAIVVDFSKSIVPWPLADIPSINTCGSNKMERKVSLQIEME
ncbi:hypothetical protein G2W53_011293 [Senna tora]|uniref:Uncharacterized protein n=1 Tax=Senna tora TaxID=362788 RepID=A0A834X1X2_9FABA|nr:hypothetical protein G2W53_011293 [Senna tora]